VNLALAAVLVVGVTVLAITAMLVVRRRAPEGSYFEDGDRASGVFGVLSTAFAIVLGFVVFLTFANYDASRAGAEAEARLVAQQFETAQFLSSPTGTELSGGLVCYARWVVEGEWPRMESGTLGERISPWNVAMFETLQSEEPETAAEEAAFGKWLDQTSDREQARADRLYGVTGVLPTPLWIVLFLTAAIVFAYMLFFADSHERRTSQAMLMGTVAVVTASLFVLLWFLDNPYHGGFGSLRPTAMERTLEVVDEALLVVGEVEIPCDERGTPRGE
jgi:hypothetical protein